MLSPVGMCNHLLMSVLMGWIPVSLAICMPLRYGYMLLPFFVLVTCAGGSRQPQPLLQLIVIILFFTGVLV